MRQFFWKSLQDAHTLCFKKCAIYMSPYHFSSCHLCIVSPAHTIFSCIYTLHNIHIHLYLYIYVSAWITNGAKGNVIFQVGGCVLSVFCQWVVKHSSLMPDNQKLCMVSMFLKRICKSFFLSLQCIVLHVQACIFVAKKLGVIW